MPEFGTRALVFRAATAAAPTVFADYTSEVSNVRITSAESDADFVSFADAAAGGARQYALALTFKQTSATTSLWAKMFGAEVGTDVPCEIWPAGRPGGGTATVSQPKYTVTATVSEPDGDLLGGEADKSVTARFLTEVEWQCLAKPVQVTS